MFLYFDDIWISPLGIAFRLKWPSATFIYGTPSLILHTSSKIQTKNAIVIPRNGMRSWWWYNFFIDEMKYVDVVATTLALSQKFSAMVRSLQSFLYHERMLIRVCYLAMNNFQATESHCIASCIRGLHRLTWKIRPLLDISSFEFIFEAVRRRDRYVYMMNWYFGVK